MISKSDGGIRKMVAAPGPPRVTGITATSSDVTLTWQSVPGWTYRVQYWTNLADAGWHDLGGDVTATGLHASKVTSLPEHARFYRVRWAP